MVKKTTLNVVGGIKFASMVATTPTQRGTKPKWSWIRQVIKAVRGILEKLWGKNPDMEKLLLKQFAAGAVKSPEALREEECR